METFFSIANALVLPQWLLMIFAPRWRGTAWLLQSYSVPVLLAIMYVYFLFSGSDSLDFRSFSTLAGVKKLFATGGDAAVLAGWIHYLAFDLVAGSVVRRASQSHSPRLGSAAVAFLFYARASRFAVVLGG